MIIYERHIAYLVCSLFYILCDKKIEDLLEGDELLRILCATEAV